jgi:hypothetical protein
MKIIVALIIAVVLGIGIGISVGWLRVSSTPWEGLPVVEGRAGDGAAAPGSPAPKVAVDQLEYDFGKMEIEKSGRREFTVTNQGNALLKLTKGETTCRCTASDLEKSELAPGESTKITLSWRPTAEPGPYKQTATFYTNDPHKSRFTITISGTITATLRARPATLTLSRISNHETTQGTTAILSYLDEPLELGTPRFEENGLSQYFEGTTKPLAEGEIKEYMGAKSGFLLTLTIKPGLPEGAFKQTITFTTNNPNRKELAIPIEGSVGSEISVVGPNWDSEHDVLYLGTVKSQAGTSNRLLLVVRGPYRREVQFKLAEPPPVPLKVTIGSMTEINNGQAVQTPLLVEIPKGSPHASYMGQSQENEEDKPDEAATIQLETTHPDVPKFRIPVRFAVED